MSIMKLIDDVCFLKKILKIVKWYESYVYFDICKQKIYRWGITERERKNYVKNFSVLFTFYVKDKSETSVR